MGLCNSKVEKKLPKNILQKKSGFYANTKIENQSELGI